MPSSGPPYTETDVVEAFVDLNDAVGHYLDILSTRNLTPMLRERMVQEALLGVVSAHTRADAIVAWISAEPDDEIDDAALDDAIALDAELDDEIDDDDDSEDEEE